MKSNINESLSALEVQEIICTKIEYNRNVDEEIDTELNISIEPMIKEITESTSEITVSAIIENQSFSIKINILGRFIINDNAILDNDVRETLLTKNALSIILPYLRSQVTIVTSQPGITPIVLPVLNLNNMIME